MLKFELSQQAIEVIGHALGRMPYDTVCTVIAELQRQINEQQKPVPKPEQKEEATE